MGHDEQGFVPVWEFEKQVLNYLLKYNYKLLLKTQGQAQIAQNPMLWAVYCQTIKTIKIIK